MNNTQSLSCRICLSGGSEDNPYARNICQCSEVNLIHVNCLILWLRQKCLVEKVPNKVYYYDRSSLRCEICQDVYPQKIKFKGKEMEIFQPEYDFSQFFFLIDILNQDS